MAMTPERWQEVGAVLEQVLERAPAERTAFLDEACKHDPALRQEVESLLQADAAASGFLEPRATALTGSPSPAAGSELIERLHVSLGDGYVIERELGGGGMSRVFVAREEALGRRIVVKVLPPDLATGLDARRFHREIRLAARLQHPHIVALHSAGQAEGLLYYTMPFVAGESLKQRLERDGPMPIAEAVRLLRDVTDGLAYAHRQGVMHRDLKPANILLEEGHALVTDFGIAKALVDAGGGSGPADSFTSTGLVLGTPAYMAPEQAVGDPADHRADLYALGCLAYALLTGQPPFVEESAQALIAAHIADDPEPVSARRPEVPPALGILVMRLLSKRPADRPQSAEEVLSALEGVEHARPAGAHAAGFRPVRRPLVLYGLAGLALLGAGGAGLFWQRSSNAGAAFSEAPTRIAVLPFENLGRPEDEYFADGMTDEIRARLTTLPGLAVIASGSTSRYKGSNKTLEQIGRELGAHYLLSGKVQWETGGRRAGHVRVRPELVQVARVPTATTIWQQTFDTLLPELSVLQSSIAAQVAGALTPTLRDTVRQVVGPTSRRNPLAYEEYLKGQQILRQGASGPADLLRAIRHLESAVSLDTSFARAWAQLGWAKATLWQNGPETETKPLEEVKTAAQRALQLGGVEAEARQTLAFYQLLRGNRGAAMQETELGLRADPSNARLVGYMASFLELEGRWTQALDYRRKALVLDPAAGGHAAGLATNLLWLRRLDEARLAADRYLILGPTNPEAYQLRAMVALAEGDLPGARRIIHSAEGRIDGDELLAFTASYWDLYWVLDDAQQSRLLELPASAFYGDTLLWQLVRAGVYRLKGDSSNARLSAEAARKTAAGAVRRAAGESSLFTRLGLANAYLGRADDAVQAGQTAIALEPLAKNALGGAVEVFRLACIQSLAGRRDEALATLQTLLSIPFYVSADWLALDPNFIPLRDDERFRVLVRRAPEAPGAAR